MFPARPRSRSRSRAGERPGARAHVPLLALAALAHNLTRAAGTLAGTSHTRATTATIRAHLINVPARLARSARRLTLHLPEHWPWSQNFTQLFSLVHAPPAP